MKEEQIGKQADELIQPKGHDTADKANGSRQERDQNHAKLCRLGKPNLVKNRRRGRPRGATIAVMWLLRFHGHSPDSSRLGNVVTSTTDCLMSSLKHRASIALGGDGGVADFG